LATLFVVALLAVLFSLLPGLPLAWKWQLGVRRASAMLATTAVVAGVALGLVGRPAGAGAIVIAACAAAISLAAAAAFVLYRFYRDPERSAPEGEGAIVSPADGEVVYVQRSHAGELPVATKQGRPHTLLELARTSLEFEDATVIGIAMSFLDVHVNRAPIPGRVTFQRQFRGTFGSLRRPEMIYENERATTVIERDGLQVAVVQIASRLVRQIVAYVGEGENVRRGHRIGVIRFGSQVDLILPTRPDLAVYVVRGDRVRAGESIVAAVGLESSPTTSQQAAAAGHPE
jgi:phosphatidylserine decarboxylase